MSQSTTKSLVDSLGFVPVLPGPCSLFRYAAFVSVSREYFQLTTMDLKGDSSDLVLGNVQLAEDRFPPVLLSFGTVDEEETPDYGAPGAEEEKGMKLPVTGFEHDAIFYFEAEKPLGQLVRQRRRWINGAYMAAYWALRGGWIGRSKQPMLFKIGAAAVLLFEVLQGAMIRTIIPATLSCGLFFMVSIIPSIYQGDAQLVEEKMNGDLDDTTYLLMGCTAAGVYLGGFLIFMIAHTPRAVANEGSKPGEIVSYHIDTKSAYRPWVFAMGFVLNFILTVM
jgi:cellulose synthase/poly-beta-1,6-N-acetylglucosamine synthase-like glycosyltransferase